MIEATGTVAAAPARGRRIEDMAQGSITYGMRATDLAGAL